MECLRNPYRSFFKWFKKRTKDTGTTKRHRTIRKETTPTGIILVLPRGLSISNDFLHLVPVRIVF